jgi:hypothetical protein
VLNHDYAHLLASSQKKDVVLMMHLDAISKSLFGLVVSGDFELHAYLFIDLASSY